MKVAFAQVLALLFCLSGVAQNSSGEVSLKIYSGFSTQETILSTSFDFGSGVLTTASERTTLFGGFSPAISKILAGSDNFAELELVSLSFGRVRAETFTVRNDIGNIQVIEGERNNRVDVRLHASYNLTFRPDKPVRIYLGFGAEPYFDSNNFKPLTGEGFDTSINRLGLRALLSPRFQVHLTERLYFETHASIALGEWRSRWGTTTDDSEPVKEVDFSSSEFDFFPQTFRFRIGLGVEI